MSNQLNEAPATSDIETKLAAFPSDLATRLRGLYLKWLRPERFPLSKSQENELVAAKLIPAGINGEMGQPVPQFCNITQFSKILMEQLGIQRDNRTLQKDFQSGFLKGTRNQDNGKVDPMAALIICRERFGDRRNDIDSESSDENGMSIAQIERKRKLQDLESESIDLEHKRRLADAKWVFRDVMMDTFASFGVTVKSAAREILEKREKRPDLFDAFQTELEQRLDQLLKISEKENKGAKAEEQRKIDGR